MVVVRYLGVCALVQGMSWFTRVVAAVIVGVVVGVVFTDIRRRRRS